MPINSVLLANTFNEFRTTVNEVITTLNGVSGGSGVINANTLIGGTVTANNLTSGRVTLSGTAGQIVDDSAFTYDTSTDILTLAGTTDASSSTTGTLKVAGGLGVAKKLYVGTDLNVTGNTTLSTNLAVTGNATITGDLTVNGTTTTINSTTLTVDDKNIELGSVVTPTDVTADGGGITLKGATDKTISWSSIGWSSSEDFNLVTGKTFEINGTSVLSSTTLGSGVTGSSLTSVGTIGTGVWQGTLIDPTYGGTGVNNGAKTITLGGNLTTSGAFATTLTATATTAVTLPTSGTLVGSADTGTVTSAMILDGTIVNGDISASAAIAYSKLALSGSIVNADIGASAAIANSKLANSALTIGSTSVSLGSTVTTFAGLTSVTSTSFVGALTGNADTATSATTAGTVTTAAQPSITSLGTLTALTVSGNVSFTSTGALKIPSGTEGQKAGFTTVGMLRFNTTNDALEVYKSGGWASAGGSGATSSVRLFAAGIASGGQLF